MERPFNFKKSGAVYVFLRKEYSDPQFDKQIFCLGR